VIEARLRPKDVNSEDRRNLNRGVRRAERLEPTRPIY
jgi:hypothetical protein